MSTESHPNAASSPPPLTSTSKFLGCTTSLPRTTPARSWSTRRAWWRRDPIQQKKCGLKLCLLFSLIGKMSLVLIRSLSELSKQKLKWLYMWFFKQNVFIYWIVPLQYLDNDNDGKADDPSVVSSMVRKNAAMVLFKVRLENKYRVTMHLVPNLPLTPKQKFPFIMRCMSAQPLFSFWCQREVWSNVNGHPV